jgi:RNA polymerase sigma-70 factor (ECF subfamily)
MAVKERSADDPDERRRGNPVPGFSTAQLESIRKALSVAVARSCPSWLLQEREDLVQTALLKLVTLLEGGGSYGVLNATYLWKTAYSVTLDEIRRARWRFEGPALDGPARDELSDTGPDPEKSVVVRERCLHVRACLKALDDSRRRAVLMRLGGYSHEETAQRLDMTMKQVANFVHRGMKDLRQCLEAKGVTG